MGSKHKPRPVVRVGWGQWLAATFAPRFVNPQRVFQTGLVAPLTLVPALILTYLTYAAFNAWASGRIEAAFVSAQLDDFRGAGGAADAADRAVDRKWADPKLHPWLREVMKAPGDSFPASRQAVALFHVPGAGGPRDEDRMTLLRRAVTGEREADWPDGWGKLPGWLAAGLPVAIKTPVAADVFHAQAGLGGGHWQKAVEATNATLADDKKKFAQRYVEGLIGAANKPIREMRRVNGWVQWLTILLTYYLLVTAARRWVMVAKLTVSAARAEAEVVDAGHCDPDNVVPPGCEMAAVVGRIYTDDGPKATPAAAAEEVQRLSETSDSAAYGLYANLAAAVPALGFLGTVIGMGDALLRADGLFSAQDKQRVVGLITQDLGFAFDTTLVALVCSPVAVVALAVVRLAERGMFTKWGTVLHTLHDANRSQR